MNRSVRPFSRAAAALVCLLIVANGRWVTADEEPPIVAETDADWPTLHRDYQRSGYTAAQVRAGCERKWFRSFVEEMIGARVEAIVAEGLCFVGTYAGNLYALDVDSGKTVWKLAAGGPIGHSPCYHGGRLYVCTDEAFYRGSVLCVRASDGRLLWQYRAGAGFWNSPACDGRQVYVGDRGGTFHAIDAETGEAAWTFDAGYMILKPASLSADGQRIVFGAEDMHVYCLSPGGQLLWKSRKLPGLSQRDQAPTIWADKVVVRTNPGQGFHESLREGGKLVRDIQRAMAVDDKEDRVVVDTPNMYFLARTDRRERAEYEGVLAYLREHPHSRTWFTLNLEDGREPWIAPILYTAGLHNPPSAPTFHHQTQDLYTIMVTALSVYCSGVSQTGIGIGRVDPQTGRVTNVAHAYRDREPGYFAGMPMIADETSSLSLMGDFLLVTHMGAVGGVDLTSRELRQLAGRRDTYGGLFGPGAVKGSWEGSRELARQGYVQNTINEWHGPDRSIVSIAAGRMFWVVGGCVVCIGPPDVAGTETGGREPLEPFPWSRMPRIDGGNVTGPLGECNAQLHRQVFDAADVARYVAVPAGSEPRQDPLAVQLRRRLDAAVTELVAGHPWAMFVVELGISHEERHFWRSGQTMQAVAVALPHLSPEIRARAMVFLDKIFADGVPLERTVLGTEGQRREYYDLDPQLLSDILARPPRAAAEIGDLYTLWAYAHYADRWDAVLPLAPTICDRFAPSLTHPARLDPDAEDATQVESFNGRIGGLIAYARIMRRAGLAGEAAGGERRLAELVTERVHFERADPRLQSRRAHHAWVPRYLQWMPELGRILSDHAGDRLAGNLDDLDRELPVWYQAWGERLIGGENYVNSPFLSRALLAAMADAPHRPPATLARYLDQPWCRADLHYIEKLTAMLRAMQRNVIGVNP